MKQGKWWDTQSRDRSIQPIEFAEPSPSLGKYTMDDRSYTLPQFLHIAY